MPKGEKLKAAVLRDYPAASEILVSFPDEWQIVDTIDHGEAETRSRLYVAAFPTKQEKPSRDHFPDLPAELNFTLSRYRLYKFFQPWEMPTVFVDWDNRSGQGTVAGYGETKINLNPLGQAQAWFGRDVAVMWECYFTETRGRIPGWQETLAAVWQIVEKDIGVRKVFTAPHEPTFETGYEDFLTRLNYARDSEHPAWWSKTISQDRVKSVE